MSATSAGAATTNNAQKKPPPAARCVRASLATNDMHLLVQRHFGTPTVAAATLTVLSVSTAVLRDSCDCSTWGCCAVQRSTLCVTFIGQFNQNNRLHSRYAAQHWPGGSAFTQMRRQRLLRIPTSALQHTHARAHCEQRVATQIRTEAPATTHLSLLGLHSPIGTIEVAACCAYESERWRGSAHKHDRV